MIRNLSRILSEVYPSGQVKGESKHEERSNAEDKSERKAKEERG